MAKAAILARPASSEMSVTLEHITPQIAAQMLEANTNNRPARDGLVQSYAEDMRAGRWQTNGDAIRFNVNGQLIDGQHRLFAVVRSGVHISSLVIRNLPPEAFQTIDGGATRKAGDLLNLMDVKNANSVASVARMAILYETGLIQQRKVSRTSIVEFVEQHPYTVEAVRLGRPAGRGGHLNAAPVSTVIFLANERRLYDDEITSFLEGIVEGARLERGDPRLALREWSVNERMRNHGKLNTIVTFAAVARAWNAYAKGERLIVIKPNKNPDRSNTQIEGFE